MMPESFEFAVVGAGFFGCRLALKLAEAGYRVVLVDRSERVCQRASRNNQARIHNGYHYPRSIMTANASHQNYDRFFREFQRCSYDSFKHVYAIARHNSHVTAYQFQRFCQTLGLPLRQAAPEIKRIFSREWIEDIFVVEEAVIDVDMFGEIMEERLLDEPNITLVLGSEVERLVFEQGGITLISGGVPIRAGGAYLALYAGTNRLLSASGIEPLDLKAEIAEICLVGVPEEFMNLGVTVMDGMFFSCIPWAAEGCHTFTHVRYTPHISWSLRGRQDEDPYEVLAAYGCETRFEYMMRDARRMMPLLGEVKYRESLFEVKVVPTKHEIDDGRPILFRIHRRSPFCASVVGAKLDSVYELEGITTSLSS